MSNEIAMRREALRRKLEAMSIPEPNSGCWLWLGCDSKGYGYVRVDGKMRIAARMSFSAYKHDPGQGHVCHTCDFPPCINPDHLFLGDTKINMDDREAKGRTWKKLTNDDVRTIRGSNESGVVLAARYGVSQSLISMVRNNKWRANQ